MKKSIALMLAAGTLLLVGCSATQNQPQPQQITPTKAPAEQNLKH